MAKGEGGGGHYDERRRAAMAAGAKPAPRGKADSPEVLAAIVKPRAKPKKTAIVTPRAKPSRVKVESNSGEYKPLPEPTSMKVTRMNIQKPLRSGARAAEARMRPPVRLTDRYPTVNSAAKSNPQSPFELRRGALIAENRQQAPVYPTPHRSVKGEQLASPWEETSGDGYNPMSAGQGLMSMLRRRYSPIARLDD